MISQALFELAGTQGVLFQVAVSGHGHQGVLTYHYPKN